MPAGSFHFLTKHPMTPKIRPFNDAPHMDVFLSSGENLGPVLRRGHHA